MTDKPSDNSGQDEDCGHLVRESHVMRSVVRNMVMNMESVLTDLQGIMGDIQSLVVQIDTVTDKIDKQCGAQGDNNGSRTTEHCVRKPQCIHVAPSAAVFNPLYDQVNSEKSHVESSDQTSHVPSHNVLQVKAFRRDHVTEASVPRHYLQPRPRTSEMSVSSDRGKLTRISCPSKSFGHFQKDSGGGISQAGGIAIVYPTIKSNPLVQPDEVCPEMSGEQKGNDRADKTVTTKTLEGSSCLGKASPGKRNCLGSNSQEVWLAKSFQDRERKDCIQTVAPQRQRITSVYNKSFQPVTPTEQRSPAINTAFKGSCIQLSPNTEHQRSSVRSKQAAQDIRHSSRVNYSISDKTLSLHHKYSSIGDPVSKGLQTQRESSIQAHLIIPTSPLLKRPPTKAVYSKIHGSPTSSRSPGSVRRPGSENYYFSIESDLDSDAVIESYDNRSMTPDIDWSYLNLVGNRNIQDNTNTKGIFETLGSDPAYEIPVIPGKAAPPFHVLQVNPGAFPRQPVINLHSSPKTERSIGQDSNFIHPVQGVMDKICNSPVIAHVYCSEVGSFQTDGYCGCYEALLDSVLENTAGFESFEEACEHLDNSEIINETYVSFDDEFEEDDWDMGMKSDDQDDYELPFFSMHALYVHERGLFEGLETVDDNRNIFAASVNSNSFREKLFRIDSNRRLAIPCSIMEGYSDVLNKKRSKRKLSPAISDDDNNDDLELQGAVGNSFTDEDCCALKPNVSTQHQNFILSPKSFVPNDLDLFSEATKTGDVIEVDTQMSSSDDTSCQAVGSGSPMSFSSPEAAFTSPDTDRFVTSSEGDDLLTSQEEAYFYCLDTQTNANVSARRTNMMQLRREFFECLYNVCEKREKENSQDNDSQTLPEENMSYEPSFSRMDNIRDNISESGSYQEEIASYNKNINTWTTYAMVHVQADDISDSTSDIFNDNNISCSMTSSYLDADNIATAPGNQALSC